MWSGGHFAFATAGRELIWRLQNLTVDTDSAKAGPCTSTQSLSRYLLILFVCFETECLHILKVPFIVHTCKLDLERWVDPKQALGLLQRYCTMTTPAGVGHSLPSISALPPN